MGRSREAGASREVGTWTRSYSPHTQLSDPRSYTMKDKDLFILPDNSCPHTKGNLFKMPVIAVSPAIKWMFAIKPAFSFGMAPGV